MIPCLAGSRSTLTLWTSISRDLVIHSDCSGLPDFTSQGLWLLVVLATVIIWSTPYKLYSPYVICIHACVYIYRHTCTCAFLYVCMYVCVCVFANLCDCLCVDLFHVFTERSIYIYCTIFDYGVLCYSVSSGKILLYLYYIIMNKDLL